MSQVIQIPGGTATIRDKIVSERHNRILEAGFVAASSAMAKLAEAGIEDGDSDEERSEKMASVHLSAAESVSLQEIQDAAIVAFLENWSLKHPLPTLDSVADLDQDLYEALAEATRGRTNEAIVERLKRRGFEPAPASDDEAPFGSSTSSSDGSTDEPA